MPSTSSHARRCGDSNPALGPTATRICGARIAFGAGKGDEGDEHPGGDVDEGGGGADGGPQDAGDAAGGEVVEALYSVRGAVGTRGMGAGPRPARRCQCRCVRDLVARTRLRAATQGREHARRREGPSARIRDRSWPRRLSTSGTCFDDQVHRGFGGTTELCVAGLLEHVAQTGLTGLSAQPEPDVLRQRVRDADPG